MRSYNGFTGSQRARAQRWLNEHWAAGTLARPSTCCACGQDQGIFDAHAEDYSEPFAAGKTDEFHLCLTCHLMLHCRVDNPAAWDRYRAAVRAGATFAPFLTRNWYVFRARFLAAADLPEPWRMRTPPDRLVLDEIEASGPLVR